MRLLLIEDDDDLSQLLVRYLGRSGFTVTRVADGDAGVEAFIAAARSPEPFEIVVTDGLLPKRNGLQVGNAIRQSPGGDKVGLALISAAFRNERARSDALEGGFDAYFAKPFVLADLRDGLLKLGRKVRPPSTPPTTAAPSSGGSATGTPTSPIAPSVGPAVVRSIAEPRRKSHIVIEPTATLHGLPSTARFFLQAARARLDGVIDLTSTEAGRVRLAFLGGVVVGAWDELPDHQLGRWLVAQGRLTEAQAATLDARLSSTKERVAEALLALGYVTGAESLALMEAQAKTRLRRALHLSGLATVTHGVDEARRLAAGVIELVEEVIAVGLEPGARVAAETFLFARADEGIIRTIDFDSGLVALARVRPSSSLPTVLLDGRRHTFGGFSGEQGQELYALWLAGLVRAESEGQGADVALPRASSSTTRDVLADRGLVEEIAGLLLRARGASVYRLLGVPTTTSTEEVRRGLHELLKKYGRQVLRDVPLGPARGAASELQALIEEGLFAFSDERRRRAYDDDLG